MVTDKVHFKKKVGFSVSMSHSVKNSIKIEAIIIFVIFVLVSQNPIGTDTDPSFHLFKVNLLHLHF